MARVSRDLVQENGTSNMVPPRSRWRRKEGGCSMARKSRRTQRLRVVNPDCAGIDIGKDRHFVAVEAERTEEPVRSFGAFTRDLEEMAAWLASCGVIKVAMESTSVYWIAVYETLERAGFEVMLVPAAHDEADRRAQERRAGLPVDLAADVLRSAAGSVPSGRRALPAALLRTPDEAADRGPLPLRPAHAQGADRDERQARLGDRQHHGTDRPAHPARDHRRRA